MKALLLSLALALSLVSPARGGFGDLYDDATLQKWQASFEEDLIWNFRNVILAKLTPEEKRALSKVQIEVPLRGKDEGVFEFYAGGGRVVMPALSLRFFGDLALASTWLNANGYNLGTVQQYVGMIHYRGREKYPNGRVPRPLEALQIPAKAREDASVSKIFAPTFTSAMIFILCHELGHVYYGHPGYQNIPLEKARANEAQADAFAVEVMRRVGTTPVGASLWFANAACVESHRVDFKSDEQWHEHLRGRTHPLTGERLEALATAIEKAAVEFGRSYENPARGETITRGVAGEIRNIGKLLKDEGVHQLFRQQSATTDPKALAPRRGVAFTVAAGNERFTDAPFDGVFACQFASKVSGQSIDLQLVLRRRGEMVTGDYSYGVAAGKVRGVISDLRLLADWTEGASRGKMAFEWGQDGKSFTGTWGNNDSRDDGGKWSGKRQ